MFYERRWQLLVQFLKRNGKPPMRTYNTSTTRHCSCHTLPAAARRVENVERKAQQTHARLGYFLPDTTFELRTPTMSPDERHRLVARILKAGDDPYVAVAGIRVKVHPTAKSYEGGALYVAIGEALGHRTYRFNARHNVFDVD